MGRPPVYRDRVRLTLLLERRELAALHKLAASAEMSTSAFVRMMVLQQIAKGKES
jgi:hypothetical protein